jgi:hypothetical protein
LSFTFSSTQCFSSPRPFSLRQNQHNQKIGILDTSHCWLTFWCPVHYPVNKEHNIASAERNITYGAT